jgi:hypothetical protein
MERREATHFAPKVVRLFDGYVHRTLSRRELSWRRCG